jgi:hypothetical protein
VTTEFLGSLAGALSFDRSVSAENLITRRAIARCGDPYAIAAEFAVIALARRAKRLAFWLVSALLGVLLAMKGHGAWPAAMQWGIPPHMRAVATIIGAIARYALLIAIFIGALTHFPSDPPAYGPLLRPLCWPPVNVGADLRRGERRCFQS